MFKITFITSHYDSSYILKKVCYELEKEYTREFNFSFFNSKEVDESLEKYEELEKQLETTSIVFLLLHGGVSSFKNFDKIKITFGGKFHFL